MCFDMVWNKSSILNGIQRAQLHFPSHTTWHTKAQGTVNKLGEVPLQGHTTCMRYVHEALLLECPLYIGHCSVRMWTDFVFQMQPGSAGPTVVEAAATEACYSYECTAAGTRTTDANPVVAQVTAKVEDGSTQCSETDFASKVISARHHQVSLITAANFTDFTLPI